MSETNDAYKQMKDFLGFGDADIAALKSLKPLFEKVGPGITDRFYETLDKHDATAKLIEGRVDALKTTHRAWMMELFGGDYGDDYFERRVKIGQAHVRINLPPQFVEGVMSFIRTEGVLAIDAEVAEGEREAAKRALMKVLDLDLIIINLAYADERVERITKLTGMRKKLIENIIKASI